MTRNEKLLEGIDLSSAVGIEIGALDKPVIPPESPGAFYVDHLDTESLRQKYQSNPHVSVENIVHVSGVWGDSALPDIASSVAPVDFLVASHVIEHVPNLIAWLKEIEAVLKLGGDLRLAIPDRRYTFDLLREETGVADVISAYLVKARVPQIRQVIDNVANVVDVDRRQIWEGTLDYSRLAYIHPTSDIEGLAHDVLENKAYHDVHCWVFTPVSFAKLMGRLAALGYHSFSFVKYFETERYENEFIVQAKSGGSAVEAAASWKVLQENLELQAAAREDATKAAFLERSVDPLNAELQSLRAEVEQLRHTVDAIKQSTSWRVTAPMRSLGLALRKYRQVKRG